MLKRIDRDTVVIFCCWAAYVAFALLGCGWILSLGQ